MSGSIRDFLRARLDPDSYLGFRLTAGLLVVLTLWLLYGGVLEQLLDAAAMVRWDAWLVAWTHAHATSGGARFFESFTSLGEAVPWTVAAVVALLLLLRRAWLVLATWVATNGGGWLLQHLLKDSVHRHRPPLATAFEREVSPSFPSGHALTATIFWLSLAWVLIAWLRPGHRGRVALWTAAAAIIVAVATSRVYLGVHYPSDVVAGVLAGGGWVAFCLTTSRVVRRGRPLRLGEQGRPPG